MDLIEPYWNVKVPEIVQQLQKISDLIEPYWNVKLISMTPRAPPYRDLIEPYWNVKQFGPFVRPGRPDDLIEPYWNVKRLLCTVFRVPVIGFNRTILECKGYHEMLFRFDNVI